MINFRKIASVLASTVMIGSTVAMAAAANFPAPFVQNGAGSVGIVYGSNAAAAVDLAAAINIQSKLSTELAAQTATGTSTTTGATVEGGDFVKLEKSTDKFNLAEVASGFYSTMDEDELSTVLATGVYSNDDNNDYDFEQKIKLGDLNLTFFVPDSSLDESEKPVIGFDLGDGDHILNYTLEFTPDAADNVKAFSASTGTDKLETTDLTLLGRTYYIQDVTSTSNGVKLTLLDTANSATVTEGETTTVTVGDNSYEVSIDYIDSDEITLVVNGVTTNSLSEGGVYKVAEDTYVAVKDIRYTDKTGTVGSAVISIGSGKIVLENGQEVEINNEDVTDIKDADGNYKYPTILTSYITNTSTKISKIVLEWDVDDTTWLVPDNDLVLPGFETIKLSMGGFNYPAKEVTKLAASGDTIKLSTTDAKGDVSFEIAYLNSSSTGIAGLGRSSTHRLVTSSSTELIFNNTKDDRFVATVINGDDAESYVLEVTDIDKDATKNATTFRVKSDGSEKVLDVGESEDFGIVRLTLNSANYATKMLNVTVSGASGGTAYLDRLVTDEGLKIQLPVDSVNTGDGLLNITGAQSNTTDSIGEPTSWAMNFTEESASSNSIAQGSSFTATIGLSSGTTPDLEVSDTSLTEVQSEDGSEVYVGAVMSGLATQISLDKGADPNKFEVEYHGDESFADVFVSEAGAAIVAATSTSAAGVKELGSVSVKDSEVSTVSSENLIVVGGSCINTVAAKLLGSETPVCTSDFTAKTSVGAGQYLIQTFASPYAEDKVATLVAGYNADDTLNAAKYLTTQTVDTTVGQKYVGTSASSAELVTTTA